ncbi:MAG: phosphoribosylamine--glycine ligase, partial [Sulfolobales archaeon]
RAREIGVVSRNYPSAIEKLDKCIKYINSNTVLIYRTDIGRDIEKMINKSQIIRYSYLKRIENGTLGSSEEWYEYV